MLRRTGAIFHKEFASYWNSPLGYIFLTLFLIISMSFFFVGGEFFLASQATMRSYFVLLPTLFLFFIPAVSMRLWAEELAAGTHEVLLTLPVKDYEVMCGKYFAALVFLSIALIGSGTLPVTLYFFGEPDWGPIIGGYLGALLMGGAFLAIGIFLSALFENQILAFLGALVISGIFFLVATEFFTSWMPEVVSNVSSYLGMGYHFSNIARGVVDSRDLLYYFSVIAFFLFLSVRAVQSRRWA